MLHSQPICSGEEVIQLNVVEAIKPSHRLQGASTFLNCTLFRATT
jgi:hypothetical protein